MNFAWYLAKRVGHIVGGFFLGLLLLSTCWITIPLCELISWIDEERRLYNAYKRSSWSGGYAD
jgi:hypothetical protein